MKLHKWALFDIFLGKNKKEQNTNISKSSTGNNITKNSMLGILDESKKNMLKKRSNNNREYDNNNNKENANNNKKETNRSTSSGESNNVHSLGKKLQEYLELTSVDRVYEENNIVSADINTIFIAESYLKTLPDHLPIDVKRKAVLDIISSSGLSADKLLKDGDERKKALKNFLQGFSQTTEKIVSEYENEIQRLSESIQANEKLIMERKELQDEQAAIINYEINRLQRIINFLQDKDS